MVLKELIDYLKNCRDEPAGTIAFEGVSVWEAIIIYVTVMALIVFLIELVKYLKG